ncbi:MAG: S-layer homology domain-containing protein, partial [Elusimicrobiales bacterium]|nr:S-layer homology domain-containing protein [Elusimicrobiales bacterium]
MKCSRFIKFLTLVLALTMLVSVICVNSFAFTAYDELHEEAQPVSDKTTTTHVTATTSDGKSESFDIVIDPEYYDISWEPNSTLTGVPGVTGTAIHTRSDESAAVTHTYRYIEHIVVPAGTTSIVGCSGHPSIVVIPRSVKTIAGFFGEFNIMKNPEQVRELFLKQRNLPYGSFVDCAYNDYYPYLMVLYEGTEAEWKQIYTPDRAGSDPITGEDGYTYANQARMLYEKGYVRFNCDYYTLTGTGTKPTEQTPVTPSKPAAATVGGFTDVSASAYYADSVQWAVENGITTGVTST